MLYTVVSEYDVFFPNAPKRLYADVKGGKVEYIAVGRNKKIVGLFSTDPAMYLEKRYRPGGILRKNLREDKI